MGGSFATTLPADPGGLTGSRCSSYETNSCLDKGCFEDPGSPLVGGPTGWSQNPSRHLKKKIIGVIQDYRVREEAVMMKRGREMAEWRGWERTRGSWCGSTCQETFKMSARWPEKGSGWADVTSVAATLKRKPFASSLSCQSFRQTQEQTVGARRHKIDAYFSPAVKTTLQCHLDRASVVGQVALWEKRAESQVGSGKKRLMFSHYDFHQLQKHEKRFSMRQSNMVQLVITSLLMLRQSVDTFVCFALNIAQHSNNNDKHKY